MPLSFKIENDKDVELAVWKSDEQVDYYVRKVQMEESEKAILDQLSERKAREWLSSRYLLHLMSGRVRRGRFHKDIHGKPHLEDSSYHVSISHSQDLVAVIASPFLVGIDIQYFVAKIHRIQAKFTNESEFSNIPKEKMLEALHIIWGAKESLYKAYGKRALNFKNHIHISGLDLSKNKGSFQGYIQKEDYFKNFDIHYRLFEKYTIVYAKECN